MVMWSKHINGQKWSVLIANRDSTLITDDVLELWVVGLRVYIIDLECHGGRGGKEGGARHQVQRGGAGSLELEIEIGIGNLGFFPERLGGGRFIEGTFF